MNMNDPIWPVNAKLLKLNDSFRLMNVDMTEYLFSNEIEWAMC